MNAKYWIEKLNLSPHPEGGFYKETHRSPIQVEIKDFSGPRNISTSIYFLLVDDNISHFHRIKSDEAWYFHDGVGLEIIIIHDGKLTINKLGLKIEQDEVPYLVVPAGAWFGSRVLGNKGHCLVSCQVSPGFDFQDFEMGERTQMLKEFPQFQDSIQTFTKS
jgi:hypothetical protein